MSFRTCSVTTGAGVDNLVIQPGGVTVNQNLTVNGNLQVNGNVIAPTASTIPTTGQIGHVVFGTLLNTSIPRRTIGQWVTIYELENLQRGVWSLSANLCCNHTSGSIGAFLCMELWASPFDPFYNGKCSSFSTPGYSVSCSLTKTVSLFANPLVRFFIVAYYQAVGNMTLTVDTDENRSYFQATRIA